MTRDEDIPLTTAEELPARGGSLGLFSSSYGGDIGDWGSTDPGKSDYSGYRSHRGPSWGGGAAGHRPLIGFDLEEVTREMVQPYMGRYEKKDLKNMLARDLPTDFKWVDPKTGDTHKRRRLDIPDYLKYDVYSLFYNRMRDIEFRKTDASNQWQFRILEKVNHHYLRTITEHNHLYTYVVSRNMVEMLMKLVDEEQKDEEQKEQEQGQGKDQGKGQTPKEKQEKQERMLDSLFGEGEDQKVDEAMKVAMKQVEKDLRHVRDAMEFSTGAGKEMSLEQVKEVIDLQDLLKHVCVPASVILGFVKNTLKFSKSYFSRQYTEREEDLLDAEEVEDLLNLEALLPRLRNLSLADLVTPDRRHHMSFDLYIDVSGSMDSGVAMQKSNSDMKSAPKVKALTLCKLLALKTMGLGFVQDVYFFENRVFQAKARQDVITQGVQGGTSINKVIRQIQANNRPSVVMTDMQDLVTEYTPNAYFIGVNNPSFNLQGEEAERFRSNRQLMEFKDGAFAFV